MRRIPCCFFASLMVFALSLAPEAAAACTGASPTWTSTPDESSLSTCISRAAAGDTIRVSRGSANWGSDGLLVSKSNIQIIGGNGGTTVITWGGPRIYHADGVRISGFTFNMTASASVANAGAIVMEGSRDWRFDHNTVNNADWSNPLGCIFALGSLDGGRSNRPSFGLIDNNTLINCRVVVWGEWSDTGGHDRWFEHGNQLGTQHAVFVEDNTYTVEPGTPGPGRNCNSQGRVLCNFVDAGMGGAIVVRFNTIHNSYFEQHSTHGRRGTKLFEVYHNTLDLAAAFRGGFSRPLYLQGSGTGVIFENRSNVAYATNAISYGYERSNASDGQNGSCTGSNPVDGNEDARGWPCLDQIGLSHDVARWSGKGDHPGQVKAPFYTWRNSSPAGEWLWVPNEGGSLANHVKENRDFYQYRGSFDGTAGIGVGPLSARPATCTTGVGYWATDQGEWNSRNPGPDGALYRCTATNTWALHYTPYPYPHPLQEARPPTRGRTSSLTLPENY